MKKFLFTILFFTVLLTPTGFLHAAIATPIKVLIVPGHDDEVWGARYGNTKEADMNLKLATNIYNTLKKDKRFEIYITRDSKGYTKIFSNYLTNQKAEIVSFIDSAKKARQKKIFQGDFIQKENPPHNNASEDVAIKLYGINKWANENKIDAVIHVHFNDYPRASKWTAGIHKGFVIYMPEEQMVNSAGSIKLAKSIFTQLHKKYATSTYEKEKGGLIQDQSLIALGSNDTLLPSVRSVLIEYGYIYRFKPNTTAFVTMANMTTAGIKNYFFGK